MTTDTQLDVQIIQELKPEYKDILTPEALEFIVNLHQKFNNTRLDLLNKRVTREEKINNGEMPDFLPETAHVRNSEWKVAPLPNDILDRRVEITGPVDRKMIINALNSGANVFMADFEDSNAPTWSNNIQGQINLKDAIRKTIHFVNPENNKTYQLQEKTAVLMVRPRGWHMTEKGITIDGQEVSASLFDFGLYIFHNAHELIKRGTGPYFYLPKLESHLEAKLWNDIFIFAQNTLHIPQGTIKATVLIETILAAFEMDEILYELKEHSAGLNCGRWDYIFSFIKKFKNFPQFILPNRDLVTMNTHFLRSYSQLVIKTCHKRGTHAMGGMAAQIPIKNDPEANQIAMEKVKNDKLREVKDGHDGTWVAHPGMVALVKSIFDEYMPTPNQWHVLREDVIVKQEDLLRIPEGNNTEEGLRKNINVGILYIESWLSGSGAAAIYNLMEDAATAEISRTQVWQWIKHQCKTDKGVAITEKWCFEMMEEELLKIKDYVGKERFENGNFEKASVLFKNLLNTEKFQSFLTTQAYSFI